MHIRILRRKLLLTDLDKVITLLAKSFTIDIKVTSLGQSINTILITKAY